jgi:hypothetical protein
MPELGHHLGPGQRQRVAACLRNVNLAREDLRTARHEEPNGWAARALRAELLAALEGYAAAIAEIGAPVPRTLQDEIALYRRLRNRT